MILSDGQFRLMFSPKDYDAAVRFYREDLGLPVDHDWDYGGGDKGTVFYAGKGMIELLGLAPGADAVKPQGIIILIQVDDADNTFQRLESRGLKILEGPTSYPWGHRIVRVADPDGITVSLFSIILA